MNALFTPTQKEINHAIRVLDAIEEGKKRNKGAVTLDGSMLDMPMVIRRERHCPRQGRGHQDRRGSTMSVNSVGREIPQEVNGRVLRPFRGAFTTPARRPARALGTPAEAGRPRRVQAALLPGRGHQGQRPQDGMTISFHHSFREGDMIIGQVLTAISELGIKGLRFAPSAVVNIKAPPSWTSSARAPSTASRPAASAANWAMPSSTA